MRVGIDIERICNLPDYIDGDEDRFFKDNFTPREIEYVLSQKRNKIAEYFTCLFSLKEAIYKADNTVFVNQFNSVEVIFNGVGIANYPGFNLSYSFSEDYCISIACTS
jgi:phosphopantetheine--protein transferase-like protein